MSEVKNDGNEAAAEEKVRYCIQLVSSENGYRSAPFLTTASQLRNTLKENEISPNDYVLVVGRHTTEEDQLEIGHQPLVTVGSLLGLPITDEELAAVQDKEEKDGR